MKIPGVDHPVYNFESVRQLLLFGLWLGFENIHQRYTAENCKKLLSSKNSLASGIVQDYYKKNGLDLKDRPRTPEGRLKLLLEGAPKMQAILAYVNAQTVLRRRKLLLFCSMPGQLVYVQAVLAEAGIKVESLHSGLSAEQKSDLQERWNTESTPMVMLTTPAIGGTGYNFQRGGSLVAFVDPTLALAVREQCQSRLYRFGQEENVESTVFTVKGTFNEIQISNEIKKALPGFAVQLDQAFFGLEVVNRDEDTHEFNTKPFKEYQKRFVPAGVSRVQGLDPEPLENDVLIRQMSLECDSI